MSASHGHDHGPRIDPFICLLLAPALALVTVGVLVIYEGQKAIGGASLLVATFLVILNTVQLFRRKAWGRVILGIVLPLIMYPLAGISMMAMSNEHPKLGASLMLLALILAFGTAFALVHSWAKGPQHEEAHDGHGHVHTPHTAHAGAHH